MKSFIARHDAELIAIGAVVLMIAVAVVGIIIFGSSSAPANCSWQWTLLAPGHVGTMTYAYVCQ